MDAFKVGFSRVDITPPLGVPVAGYYESRFAEKVLDDLEINTIAVSDGERTALLMSCDIISISHAFGLKYRENVSRAVGVPLDAVFLACTHTHTGPGVGRAKDRNRLLDIYDEFLGTRLCDAAKFAVADLKPARMGFARSVAPRLSFVRRYTMRDGSTRTNPGVNNPDVVAPVGTTDDTVQLLRIEREGGCEIDIVNFQTHPDVIGGNVISADWPRFVRETMENAIPGINCVFFNGTQGDTNHVNVQPRPGELNGMFHDFDDVWRGYPHALHMGRSVAAAALAVWGKCVPVDSGEVRFGSEVVEVPSNRVGKELIPEAERILRLHAEGRDDELPWKGMDLTTAVAEAERMKELENGPDSFMLPVSAVAFGNVAFAGFPGEPFTDVGCMVKAGSPFELTIPTCLTNGAEGYFPMMGNFDEGGYEARSSTFKAGVAEALVAGQLGLLKRL